MKLSELRKLNDDFVNNDEIINKAISAIYAGKV